MSDHKAWGEIKRSGQPDLVQGFDAAISVSLWLPELRRRAGLTQEQLASRLGVSQSWISQIEHETDVRLSTISAYVAALGGRLSLNATLPNGQDIDLRRMPVQPELEQSAASARSE
jgi:transcriptional regulator with XRE-family HTH domain